MNETLKILLVEDNPSDAELMKREFVKSGKKFELRCVLTKAEFEKALETELPDLVLSDYSLPEFDGMSALNIVKQKKLDIPFIIVTGSINEETAVDCIKAGAQDYVIKQHLKRLIPAVDAALENFRIRIEKELAKKQLDKSEAMSKLLMEQAGLPVLRIDGKGVILALNDTAAGYARLKPEAMAGKSLFELLSAEDAERYVSKIKRTIDSRKGFELKEKLTVFGEERCFVSNVRPVVVDGAVSSVQVIVHDVTEQNRIDEALRESEERYRKLVELSTDSIAVHSEGKLVYVNNACLKMMGVKRPEDLLGRDVISLVHPDYWETEKLRAVKLYGEKGAVPFYEEKLIKFDGSPIDAEISAAYFTFRGKPSIQVVFRDITARKRADEDLKASAERLREVFESVRDIIFILSKGGVINSLNPAFEMLSGWRTELWEHKKFSDLVHPDDSAQVEAAVARCFGGEIPPALEARLLTKGKGCRYFEIKLTPLFKNGEVNWVQGTASDINERKYAEVYVRKSRDFYQKLFDELPNPMWSTGKDGKFNFINKSGLEFRGRTLEQEMNGGWIEGLHEDDREAAIEAYRAAFEKRERYCLQFRLRRHDGQYRWVLDYGSPYEDLNGNYGGFVGVCHDITDMKNSAEALKSNNEVQAVTNTVLHYSLEAASLEDILDKVLDILLAMPCMGPRAGGAVFLLEKNSGLFALNARKNFPEWKRTDAEKPSFNSELCRKALESGRLEFTDKFSDCFREARGGDGNRVYCFVPIRSSEKVLGIIVLGLNREVNRAGGSLEFLNNVSPVVAGIIQRKQAENEMELYHQHMVQSSKLSALGEMAAGVAHEINNPLTIIMGNAQYLLENELSEAEPRKIVSEIDEASQRCKKIISGLLGFSRREGLKFHAYSINEIAADAVRFCDSGLKQKKIDVRREFSADLPKLRVSRSHLQQVFVNIIINALQAMELGGVLSVRTGHSADNNYAEISFSDTGKGIRQEHLPKIFEPFFTTKQKGTGLGLAVSYGLIKQHGGEIRVASAGPGKGSVFTVSLPITVGGDEKE